MRQFVSWLETSRRTIFFKLLSGFASIAIFLAVIVVISLISINQLGNSIKEVSDSQQSISIFKSFADDTQRAVRLLGYARTDMTELDKVNTTVSGTPLATAIQTPLNNYARTRQELITVITALQDNLIIIGNSGNVIASLNPNEPIKNIQRLLDKMDEVVDASTKLNSNEAHRLWLGFSQDFDTFISQGMDYSSILNQLVKNSTADNQKKLKDANDARAIAQWFMIIVGALVVALALIFGVALTFNFTRPLEKLRQRLLLLAEGDLITPLDVPNQDQFGDLAATFNQSIERLGAVLEQVQEQAVKVSSASAEIATASRQSAQISADQAGAVAEATVTMEELSFTAQQIAEAATLVAQAAEQALTNASEGQETVKESIIGINSLKDQVQDIAHKILALSERSQRVGHIIDQITSIADRTHLLALNAAIESAAAGENGKRFAVVAAEVKKLAESSRSATKEVQFVLSEIQEATNASVMATEQGMKDAEKGVGLAHRSGDANQTIIMMVERTAQLSSAISLATQQQRGASEQVVTSMRQLATVIQEGATSARQSSALAMSLDEVANDLRLLSRQFKVDKSDDDNIDPSPSPDPEVQDFTVPSERWETPSFGPALG